MSGLEPSGLGRGFPSKSVDGAPVAVPAPMETEPKQESFSEFGKNLTAHVNLAREAHQLAAALDHPPPAAAGRSVEVRTERERSPTPPRAAGYSSSSEESPEEVERLRILAREHAKHLASAQRVAAPKRAMDIAQSPLPPKIE